MPQNLIYSERSLLFEPNVYIQFLFDIEGNPTTEQLLGAVKAAFANNESTMSKIVLQSSGTAFYEKLEQSACKVSVTKKNWEEIEKKQEKIPFDIKSGEMMRVFIITHADKTQLYIMAHHLVGDGKSITYFVEDVMNALAGNELTFKPLSLITAEDFPKEAKLPHSFCKFVKKRNRKWAKVGRSFGWEDYLAVHKNYWKNHSSCVLHEHFSAKETENIHNCAKNAGVTINTFIAGAFLCADPTQKKVGMAVDIRNDGDKSMANKVSGISTDFKYKTKKSFEENLSKLHKKIYKKLLNPKIKNFILQFNGLFAPSLYDSILAYTVGIYESKVTRKLSKTLCYRGGEQIPLGITNLTKLDIPDTYGDYTIKNLMFIPPDTSYSNRVIGVVTTGDGMTVSFHFMSNKIVKTEKEFFNRAINHLTLAAGKSE